MIKNAVKSMNTVLKEIIIGILLLGILFQLVFMWFFSSKLMFTLGLWVGVVLSVFMAVHMNYGIERMLERPEEDSRKYMAKMVAIRMVTQLAVFLGMCLLEASTGLAVLLGIFTLKTGAYVQPHLHRLVEKRQKGG